MLESLIVSNAPPLPKVEHRSVIQGPPKSPPQTSITVEPTEPLDCKVEPESRVPEVPEPLPVIRRPEKTSRSPESSPTSSYVHPDLAHLSTRGMEQQESAPVHLAPPMSPEEPADLSNKKPENVTCVPEIDYIKEEINDAASDYSNSSDPERLEVDMSQVSYL